MTRSKARQSQADTDFEVSSSQTQSTSLSESDLDTLTNDCVRYILNAAQNWSTVRRQCIVKNALKGKSRAFNTVIESVKNTLKEVYGYDLKVVDPNKAPNLQQFFLVHEDEDQPSYAGLNLSDDQKYTIILRFLILAHIHLSGGQCTDESLEKFLGSCEISQNHDQFGDIKKRITELQRQNYIVISEQTEERIVYAMGARAEAEYKAEDFENWHVNLLQNEEAQQEATEDEQSEAEDV